jgi:hypothetical protein
MAVRTGGVVHFGSWFAPYGIDQQFLGYQLLPPSWSRYGEVSFFLGTDDLGRDVLSRLLSGAAPTVGGAFVVTLAATICGLALGIFAGSTHGLRSAVMNHILDTLLSIPSLLLAIIVVAFAGPHLSHAMFAVWLAILPRLVRSVYSMVHDELEKEYVVPHVWMVPPRSISCGLPCCQTLRPGWSPRSPVLCRWRFWISPRWASSILALSFRLPNGEQCSATRWNLSMSLHGPLCCPGPRLWSACC